MKFALWVFLIAGPLLIHAWVVSSNFVEPPIQMVLDHNQAEAASLWGINPHSVGHPYVNPNPHDPLVSLSATAITLMPSVDQQVSKRQNVFLVWSWQHDQIPYGSWGDVSHCGDSLNHMTFDGSKSSFSLFCQVGNLVKTQSDVGDPAALPCTPSDFQGHAGQSLSVGVSGTLSLNYRVQSETLQCIDACGPGGCIETYQLQNSQNEETFQYSVSSNALTYGIEPDGARDFLAEPFSNEQSLDHARLFWEAFSNADAGRFYEGMDGRWFNASYLARYSIDQDDQGVWTISKTSMWKNGLDSTDTRAVASGFFLNDTLNGQSNVAVPRGGGLSNDSFVHAYWFNDSIGDEKILGDHVFSFRLMDDFNDALLYRNYSIRTVEPIHLTLKTNASTVVQNGELNARVQLLDSRGLPMPDQIIELNVSNQTLYASTNDDGAAFFDLTLDQPGFQTITAGIYGNPALPEQTARQNVWVQSFASENRVFNALQRNASLVLSLVLLAGLMVKVKL